MKSLLIALLFTSSIALAGTPTLVAHDAGAYSVSLPKGWTVVDSAQGTVVAQQNPNKKDAAQLLVIVSSSTASADDLLDALVKNALVDAKVQKREAIPGGTGKLLVADGKTEGIAARLGAIAISGGGAAVVAVLISKTGEFDGLGGTNTLVAVLASVKVGATATANAPTTSKTRDTPAPAAGARDPVMTPELNGVGGMVYPKPKRTLELVDFVGEWNGNDGAAKSYVSSNGSYAGFSSVSTAESWSIDAKGNVVDNFAAGYASSGGGHGFKQRNTGTLTVSSNNTLAFHYPAQNGVKEKTEYYIITGWFVGPEVTMLRVNGAYYVPITDKQRADAVWNSYDSHTFVIHRMHP